MLLSIIIPLYNEAENLPKLSDKLANLYLNNIETEIFFIDDNSTDNTPELLEKICVENPTFNF
ncbi:MAG: glycosyltransferase [Bacteroidetes bacterium]|nr:glycosyltransferase [Bacteroidota bacterium]